MLVSFICEPVWVLLLSPLPQWVWEVQRFLMEKKKAHTQHVQDYLYWNLPTVLWGFLPALESDVPGIIILLYIGIRMFIQNNKCYYQYRAWGIESEGRSIEVHTSSYFLSTFILFTYQPLTVSLFGFVFLHCFHNRKIKISYQIIIIKNVAAATRPSFALPPPSNFTLFT